MSVLSAASLAVQGHADIVTPVGKKPTSMAKEGIHAAME
jgi:hypothetical protein